MNRILLNLAARGIRYRCLKATGRPAHPEVLSLEITQRCIAKCLMCNIWQIPAVFPELEARNWLELLLSPVLSELKELDKGKTSESRPRHQDNNHQAQH